MIFDTPKSTAAWKREAVKPQDCIIVDTRGRGSSELSGVVYWGALESNLSGRSDVHNARCSRDCWNSHELRVKMAPDERREHCRIPVVAHRYKLMDSRPAEASLLRNLRPNRNYPRMRLRILRCISRGRPQRRSASLSCRIILALVWAHLKQLQAVSISVRLLPSEPIHVEVNLSICSRYRSPICFPLCCKS